MVAAAVAGVLITGVDQVGNSIADRSDDVSGDIRTDVTIVSDPGVPSAIYNATDENATVLLKNTGSNTLVADPDQIDLLINGRIVVENVTVERVDDQAARDWPRNTVVRITVSDASPLIDTDGDNRITVDVNNNRDTIEFRL